jgi:hypothetical protein
MMRIFKPELRPAVLLPPQATLDDKFGGLPWGLPSDRWPVCVACGQPQSLLAQLRHHPDRLDLGRAGRVLHVFQCADWANTGCNPFKWGAGASACFVLEPEELGAGLTPPRGLIGKADDPWAWHGHIAARVASWLEGEDSLPADQHDAYFDRKRWWKVPYEVRDAIDPGAKLGGIPHWGNVGPSDHLPRPWRLAVQMVDDHFFSGPAPEDFLQMTDESGQPLTRSVWESEDGSGWDCRWANFATGIGYVYLDEANPPAARFTWQRLI